jgi:hypothetical protein
MNLGVRPQTCAHFVVTTTMAALAEGTFSTKVPAAGVIASDAAGVKLPAVVTFAPA